MKISDYIILTMKNSNSAYVELENREFECSRNTGECLMAYAKEKYTLVGVIRNLIGDVKYIFN